MHDSFSILKVHDACIELAEMLAKSDPKGAVDVYCKFHISDPPTFDDGFILGEIVRLLMKAEDYEDKRLVKNMILYGKVYGLGKYEQHAHVKILLSQNGNTCFPFVVHHFEILYKFKKWHFSGLQRGKPKF